MGLSIHYRSVQPMHPALAFELKKRAVELNELYEWGCCEEVTLNQQTDGLLQGSSATSFVADPEELDEHESIESAGDMATLVDVLCELSRCHEVDWEIRHDYEPDVIGFIREGVADLAVIEELETIRTIGEMLGDFDDDEVIEDMGQSSLFSEIAAELSDDQEGPRLLKFPGIN